MTMQIGHSKVMITAGGIVRIKDPPCFDEVNSGLTCEIMPAICLGCVTFGAFDFIANGGALSPKKNI